MGPVEFRALLWPCGSPAACLHVLLTPFLFSEKQSVVEDKVGHKELGQLICLHDPLSPNIHVCEPPHDPL